MKTTKLLGLLMLLFLLSCCSITAKDVKVTEVTKQIPAKEFSSIKLKGAADIIYDQGQSSRVSITAPENVIDLVEVSFNGSSLLISTDKLNGSKFGNNLKITIQASSPTLTDVNLAGAGDITLKGTCTFNRFNVASKGAGDVKAEDLHCENFYLDIKGAGDIDLKGAAKEATFMIKGAGDINAFGFKVGSLVVDIKGAGDVNCNASELSIDSSGAGDIRFKGKPVIKKMDNRGAGSVRSVE